MNTKPIDSLDNEKENKESNEKNQNLEKKLKNTEDEINKKIEEESKKKEEEKKKKKEEFNIKQKKDYEETRIEIKNIFIPKKKYEKGNYYDIVIKMNLLNELTMDGWEIDYSSEINFEEVKIIPVSVIGESNRGKSYLLGKITNHELPEGFSEKTEGISVKYLLAKESDQSLNCILIDSAGGQTQIIKSDKYDEYFSNIYKNIKIKELKKQLEKNKKVKTDEKELKQKIDEIKNKKIDPEIIKIKDENAYNDCLKKLILDKTLTEQFIKDFALSKSNIILLVVGQLTITEQLFINNLKNTITKNKAIIIIHNLLNFVKKKQVEDYINDVLKKSIFFNLEEIEGTQMEDEDKESQSKNNIFYREKFKSLEGEKEMTIIHAIFANDSKESEAGNYYNYPTIKYIRTAIMALSNPKEFNIVEELREYIIEKSYKYIDIDNTIESSHKNNQKSNDKDNKIDSSDKNNQKSNEKNKIMLIDENNLKIYDIEQNKKKKIMKLMGINILSLKKITIDESGNFKYTGNSFVPYYNYYKKTVKRNFLDKNFEGDEDVDVLIIMIELPGKIENLKQKIEPRKEKYFISISGVKKLSKINDISYLYSDLDENEFRIEFEINMEEVELKDNKLIKNSIKDGIVKLYYEIKKKEKEDEKINVITKKNVSDPNEENKDKKKKNKEEKKDAKKDKNK